MNISIVAYDEVQRLSLVEDKLKECEEKLD
jgi:hypothetical protein